MRSLSRDRAEQALDGGAHVGQQRTDRAGRRATASGTGAPSSGSPRPRMAQQPRGRPASTPSSRCERDRAARRRRRDAARRSVQRLIQRRRASSDVSPARRRTRCRPCAHRRRNFVGSARRAASSDVACAATSASARAERGVEQRGRQRRGSVCAPPTGSATISSMMPSASRSGAVIFSASAASTLLAGVAPQDRGAALGRDHAVDRELVHQDAIADGDAERAAAAALAVTTTMIGTSSTAISRRFSAIASAMPRSSDSMPGIGRRRVDEGR